MKARNILTVLFVATVVVSLSADSHHSYDSRGTVLQKDGGRPIPPYPTGSTIITAIGNLNSQVSADGGRPIPPYPTGSASVTDVGNSNSKLSADGGRPIPPYPTGSTLTDVGNLNSKLSADGGRPIPPYPTIQRTTAEVVPANQTAA